MDRVAYLADRDVPAVIADTLSNRDFLEYALSIPEVQKRVSAGLMRFSTQGMKRRAIGSHLRSIVKDENIRTSLDLQRWLLNFDYRGPQKVSHDNYLISGGSHIQEKGNGFIGPHYCILDGVYLKGKLLQTHFTPPVCVIGDNLAIKPELRNFFLATGCVILPRDANLDELGTLSNYLRELRADNQSFWMAQKSGRCKDGKVSTDSRVLINLLRNGTSREQTLDALCLTPTVINYDWHPCDIAIAQARFDAEQGIQYTPEQKQRHDRIAMNKELHDEKGTIYLTFSKPLSSTDVSKMRPKLLAEHIDKVILETFPVSPTQVAAYHSLQHNTDLYSELPSSVRKHVNKGFFDTLMSRISVCENPIVRRYALDIYAGPLKQKEELGLPLPWEPSYAT